MGTHPLRRAAVAAVAVVPLLAACGSKPVEQPRVPSAYCDSILEESVESPAVARMTCVAEVKRLRAKYDLTPYDANGDGLLNLEESLAAFGPPLDLVRAASTAAATTKPSAAATTTTAATTPSPATVATSTPRAVPTTAERPQIPTSPPAAPPSARPVPAFPAPPAIAPGPNREWASYGPYPSLSACGQAQGAWPERTSECFMFDGQAYYFGVRQSSR